MSAQSSRKERYIEQRTTNISDLYMLQTHRAFNKVGHSLLVHKLKHYGSKEKVKRWIASFLSHCTQAVV